MALLVNQREKVLWVKDHFFICIQAVLQFYSPGNVERLKEILYHVDPDVDRWCGDSTRVLVEKRKPKNLFHED